MLPHIFDDAPERTRGKLAGLYALLVSANIGVWLWAVAAFHENAFLLGTAFLAYSFGLRHAFDADHIAAIDNITRKLMQEGRRPVAVGFFFSLGHATIVVALVLAIAPMTAAAQEHFAVLKDIGGTVATTLSAAFLFAIAAANVVALAQIYGALRANGKNGLTSADHADHGLNNGPLARLFRPLFALIGRSWHAYPLGLLFGLGFDTATEVGLLGVSAGQAAHGLSLSSILIFPALFTAGMSLVDTTDGVLMVQTYGWAFIKPVRKLYYNLTMTLISIVVALLIGGVEVLGLLANKLGLEGRFWSLVDSVNESFGLLGYLIVGVFIAGWIISVLIYRVQNLDKVGESLSPGGDR
jgi:nickel/cobalt transporter (NiCoT) family protein